MNEIIELAKSITKKGNALNYLENQLENIKDIRDEGFIQFKIYGINGERSFDMKYTKKLKDTITEEYIREIEDASKEVNNNIDILRRLIKR